MVRATGIAILALVLAAAPAAVGQDTTRGAHRQAGAHTHGVANLLATIEGNELYVELESPLYNLLGFERAPKGEAEIAAWMAAARAVRAPAQILGLPPAAQCQLSKSSLGVFGGDATLGAQDDPHAHAAGHDADRHDEADHAESNVVLSWTFRCIKIEAVTSIEATVLRTFPRITRLTATYLDATTQKAERLTPASSRFRIR